MADRHERLAIMFTDIQGYSSMMAADEATTVRVVREHREIVRAALAAHGGRERTTIGDAFLALFDRAADGVACGIALQERLLERNRGLPRAEQVRIRVGLHVGDVLVGAEGELYGDALNVAARLEPIAPSGGLCISERVYDEVVASLRHPVTALGAVPLKNIEAPPKLFAIRVDPEAPEPRSSFAPTSPTNLVAPSRSVVGRRREVEALRASLRAGSALLTVIGPGGTGKTTLLGLLGRDELGRWPGGVWFCGLAEARDPSAVGATVAAALDLVAGADAAAIGEALAARPPTLLLLDNAEQATEAVRDLVGRWSARAPGVAFVVTSRERLGLGFERVFPLDALPSVDARQLFLDRARSVRPDFVADCAEGDAVDALVLALDGLPLAIEICAARVRLEPPTRLLARLPAILDLRAAAADGPSRQRTLRSTIAWSWALLAPAERVAMAQLSVFAGPYELEAAEAVLALEGLEEADPVQLIESLVDKSLVRGGLDWYETLRTFAAEQLADADAVPGWTGPAALTAARDRHALWFASWRPRPGGPRTRDRVENLRVALDHAIARGWGEPAGQLWLRLVDATRTHGPLGALVTLGQKLPPIADRALRWRVAYTFARVALDAGHRDLALAQCRRAEEDSQGPEEQAQALHTRAAILMAVAPNEETDAACAAGLALTRDDRLRARLLLGRACTWVPSDPERFRAINTEFLATCQRVDARALETVGLHNEALLRVGEGRFDEAEALTSANLAFHRERSDRDHLPPACMAQAQLENLRGRWAAGKAYASEGLSIALSIGDARFTAAGFGALALAEAGLGEREAARRHAAEAVAVARRYEDEVELCEALATEAWALALTGAEEGARAALAEAEILAERRHIHPIYHVGALLAGARSALR